MGVCLQIDDFGMGYSSLTYLHELPIGALKIDRSFIQSMTTNRSAALIVRSTIHLAHDLGLRAVAEGVEDEATLARLRELQCDAAQGYLLSRPAPAGALEQKLRVGS